MYSVKLEFFEGPLDLLLHLVEKNKLDISEVSLTSICGEYKAYLTKLRDLNLELESSFITVFAELLHMKSRALLPIPPQEEDVKEELQEHELVAKLKEYQKFKLAAEKFNQISQERVLSYTRNFSSLSQWEESSPVLTTQLTPYDLMDLYVDIVRRTGIRNDVSTVEIPPDDISYPFIFKLISKKIRESVINSLEDLFDSPPDKIRFIMTFLVLLEMARRRRISLIQEENQEGIKIVKLSCDTSLWEGDLEPEMELAG